MSCWKLGLGANFVSKNRVHFSVWAPFQSHLQVQIHGSLFPMERDRHDYFHLELDGLHENDTYMYVLANGKTRPDPVSRYLPQGVFGPTAIIDCNAFTWTDQNWKGIKQEEYIFYECHVGTFTPEGTFEGILKKLKMLKALGITCLELMPIAQFSGNYGWGYDGVSPYAPHNAYGDPASLKKLINACHECGLAVCLDVVYNHFGPEGCFIGDFGPYWTDRYKTPWGNSINYDGPYSDGVRAFILQNALYFVHEYHIDALRLDALHALYDFSASPLIQELSMLLEEVGKEVHKKIHLIAESDLNDSRLIRPRKSGGYHLDALWNEDFHHALHVSLTGETHGYYEDFQGLSDFAKALKEGVIYQGKYSSYRKKNHGNSFEGIEPQRLVSFLQNHDQVGNRLQGDRIATHLTFEEQKIAAFILLLSPYLPLLFMGQEYGEEAPFEYFVNYENEELTANVYAGRKREFHLEANDMPLPDKEAFLRSKLRWDSLENPKHKALFKLHQELIQCRKAHPIFKTIQKKDIHVYSSLTDSFIAWEYRTGPQALQFFCTFSKEKGKGKEKKEYMLPFSSTGKMELLLHTEEPRFAGSDSLLFTADQKKLSVEGPCAALFEYK